MIAGDFFIIRINEPELSEKLREFLQEIQPIGVHFGYAAFCHDLTYRSWIQNFSALRDSIQEATGRDKMIWAIDHEGGRVHRVPPPLTHFSYPLNWREHSFAVGHAIGRELQSLGINVLFGPSLDIYSNSHNTVIGPRSFGTTVPPVHEFTSQYIEAIEQEDIIATIKHFPGHGETEEDSHYELPLLPSSLAQLRERELLPFQYSINGGIQSVMIAHILFPEIDPHLPASLSPTIANTLLRKELGFSGVSFTDDLDMQAIYGKFSAQDIALQTLQSETNFLIFNHHLEHARDVARELTKHIPESLSSIQGIEEKTMRFLTSLADNGVETLSEKTLQSHQRLSEQLPECYQIEVTEYKGD